MLYDMKCFYYLEYKNKNQFSFDVEEATLSHFHLFPNSDLITNIATEWSFGKLDCSRLKSYYAELHLNSQYMPLGILIYKVIESLDDSTVRFCAENLVGFFVEHQATKHKYSLKQSAHMFSHLYKYLKDERPQVAKELLDLTINHQRSLSLQKSFTSNIAPEYAHSRLNDCVFHKDLISSFNSEHELCTWLSKNLKPKTIDNLVRCDSFSNLIHLLTPSSKKKLIDEGFDL